MVPLCSTYSSPFSHMAFLTLENPSFKKSTRWVANYMLEENVKVLKFHMSE